MADISIENNEIGNEPLTRLEIASISLLFELGIDPMDAYNLICELKASSPEYHKRILEIAQLYLEARSTLLYLLKEIEKTKQLENAQNQETLTKISSDGEIVTNANIQNVTPETAVNHNLQQADKKFNENAEKIEETVEKPSEEKAEEKILEKLREMAQVEVKGSVSPDVKEDIPIAEKVHILEHTSQEIPPENKEEMEKWLSNTEKHFEEMPVETQEKTMPRYIQLRTLTCKDKIAVSPSCIGCLISNTIDCPLFNRTSKKR